MYPEPNCTELLSLSPDLTGECGAECEIILPDYCPNILRILQTTVTPSIQSQTVGVDRLTVEGKAEYRILYLAEDGSGLKTVSQQTAFSCTLDRKTDKEMFYTLSACAQNCVGRALNSRKIYARSSIHITAQSEENIPLPSGNFEAHERKIRKARGAKLLCSAEKPLRISDEFETDGKTVSSILHQRVFFRETEQKPLTDKLIVKADMIFDLLCLGTDGAMFPLRKSIPVSQILDLPGLEPDAVNRVRFDLIFLTLSLREEGGGAPVMSYDAEIGVTCKTYIETDAEWTEDVFSVKKKLECEKREVCSEAILSVRESGALRETVEIGTCSDLLWAEMLPERKSIRYDKDQGRILCEGAWECRLIVTDAEGAIGTVVREIPFTLSLSTEEECLPVRNDTELILTDLAWSMTDAEHGELRGTYEWRGLIFTRQTAEIVTDVKEIADRPREEDTVVLYYAAEGESAWDIAKEHACRYDELRRENDLSEDRIRSDRMLVILR